MENHTKISSPPKPTQFMGEIPINVEFFSQVLMAKLRGWEIMVIPQDNPPSLLLGWFPKLCLIKGSVQSRNCIHIISRLDITEFAGAFSGAVARAFKAPAEAPAKRAPLIPHP